MLNRWLTRRRERRRARLDARAESARVRTFAVVRDVAEPLVTLGVARLEWTEPNPTDEWFANGAVRLVPANDAAAPIQVFPDVGLVTLLVGPNGHSHELVIDSEDWQEELRSCLQAVIDGRYRERTEEGHLARCVVTMTFEQPGGNDVVVKHFALDADHDQLPGERRFASYREYHARYDRRHYAAARHAATDNVVAVVRTMADGAEQKLVLPPDAPLARP